MKVKEWMKASFLRKSERENSSLTSSWRGRTVARADESSSLLHLLDTSWSQIRPMRESRDRSSSLHASTSLHGKSITLQKSSDLPYRGVFIDNRDRMNSMSRDHFDSNGISCGREEAHLLGGYSSSKEIFLSRRSYIEGLLAKDLNEMTRQSLQYEYDYLTQVINNIDQKIGEPYYDNLVSCNDFRNRLKDSYSKISEFNYHEVSEAIARVHDEYIPIPINFWKHGYRVDSQESCCLRFGAIYDNRSSHFCTQDLVNDQGELDLDNVKQVRENLEKDIQRLLNGKKLSKLKPSQLKKVSAYMHSLEMLSDKNMKRTLAQRQSIAFTQFITVLQEHIRNKGVQEGEGEFKMVQLSLLNPRKKTSKNGWSHCEINEIAEMSWLFDKMNNAKIVFDLDEGSSPYFQEFNLETSEKEDPAIIHMPRSLLVTASGETRNLVLKSHFINIDVQNLRPSKQMSQWLASQVSSDLQLSRDAGMQSILEKIRNGQSGYTLTQTVLEYFDRAGYGIGVNCQSAKDRTGIVLDQFFCGKIKEHLSSIYKNQKKLLRRILKPFNKIDTYRKDGLAIAIIKRNTGLQILKAAPWLLPGFWNKVRFSFYYLRSFGSKVAV